MPRGPRRGNARMGEAPTDAKTQRRHERKLEKVLANSHGGFAGKSIVEMLEDELTTACIEYRAARESLAGATGFDESGFSDTRDKVATARGRIRGLAISIATMRHPLRRHEPVWWEYVKKLEKRHIQRAKELNSSSE